MEKDSKRETSLVQQIDLKTLKFEPKKTTQTLAELFGKAYCYVCFRFHEFKNERKTPIYEKGMEMLVCYGCGVTVHHYCYGFKTPYNDVVTEFGDKIKKFVCDKCKDLGPDVVTECGICYQKIGAFKRTSNDTFVHITCALFSELYEIDYFETMSVWACPKSEKRVPKQNKHCDHCRKSANLFKCSVSDCDSYVHIYCAFMNKIEALVDNEESQEGWAIRFFKEGNATKVTFDPNDPKLKESLRKLYEKVIEASKRSLNNEEEAQMEDSSPQKKKSKKKAKSQSKTEMKIQLSEDDENLLNAIYDDFKTKATNLVKRAPAGNASRGGSLKFECQTHRTAELYCVCNLPYDQLRFMVGCDSCDNWFHCTCLGLSEDQAQNLKNYFCKKCKDWSNLKQNVLQQSAMEVESTYKTVDKAGVIPKDTSRFMIIDFLLECILLEQQVAKRLRQTGDVNVAFDLMVDGVKYIPFNLNAFITNSIRRHYFAEILDDIIEKQAPLEEMDNIKGAFDPSAQKTNTEDLGKLNQTYNYFTALLNIYQENLFSKTPLVERIEKFTETLQWIISFHSSISNSDSRPSLKVLQQLNSKAESLNLNANLPEVIHLKELQEKAASWTMIAEKVASDKPKDQKEKGHALENLNLQHLPLPKALELLEQAVQGVKTELNSKPTLEQLKELVYKGQELGVDVVGDLGNLNEKYKKGLEIERRLHEKVSTLEELQGRLRELEGLPASSEEIVRFLELFHRAKVVQLKLKSYAKFAMNVNTKRKKSEDKIKNDEDDEKEREKEVNGASQGESYPLEDIEETLKEAETLGLDYGEDRRNVEGLMSQVQEFKERVKDALNGVIEISELKALLKEAGHFNVKFQEVAEIKQKNELYSEIKGLLSKPCSTEQLVQVLEKLQKNFHDPRLQSGLETKLNKARDLEARVAKFLSQATFSKIDINETAQFLLSDLKSNKVEVPQKNEIAGLHKSLKWLEKLFSFYQKNIQRALQPQQNTENKGDSGEMEIEHSDVKLKDPEKEGSTRELRDREKESTIEFMTKTCLISDENVVQDIQKHFGAYKNIVKEGQGIPHLDERIKKIFAIHGTIFWCIEAFPFLEKAAIKGEDLNNLYEMAQQFHVDPSNETYLRFIPIYEEYRGWLEEYNALVKSEDFSRLASEQMDEGIKERITKLLNEYSNLHVQLDEEHNNLKNALARIEWSKKAQQALEAVQQGQKITFDSIQELVSYANLIKIPQESTLYKEVKSIYQNQKKLRDMYLEFCQAKNQAKDKMEEIYKDPGNKNKKKELTEINRLKPQLSQAIQLDKAIERSSLLIPTEEVEELQMEIRKTEAWGEEVRKFLEKYPINDNTSFSNEMISDITRDLNSIRTEMAGLLLQDDNSEQKIHKFEWTFHANLTVHRKGHKPGGIEVWRKLIKLAQKDKGSELVETQLFKAIQEQIVYYNGLAQKIADLKAKDNYLQGPFKGSKTDFANMRKALKDEEGTKRLMQEVSHCKIDMPEEKKYLEELLARGKKAFEGCKKVTQSEDKVPIETVKSTLEHFHKIPIKYLEQEKVLEGYLEKAKQLQNMVQDWKNQQKLANPDIKIAEAIHNQYKDCPVYLPEVAKISKGYREATDTITKIEEMLRANPDVSFEDLLTLNAELEDVKFNIGPRADEARRRLWLAKIKSFRDFKEKKVVPNNPISFNFLKNCVREGYELMTSVEAIRELKESVRYIEELIREVETHLNDLYNIRDTKLLEDISYTLYDFIDLREEIIDYKAQISISNDYKAVLEPIVWDLGKKEDQEILRIVKNKEYLQREEKQPVRDLASLKKEREKDKEKEKEKEKEREREKEKEKEKEKAKEKEKELRPTSPTQVTGKRKISIKQNDDFVYDMDFLEEGSASKNTEIGTLKKIKSDPLELKRNQSIQSSGSQQGQTQPQSKGKAPVPVKKEKVEEENRAETRRRFTGALRANPQFTKSIEEAKNIVKLLEMNLFSDFHDDKFKYNKKTQIVVDLFVKLKEFPSIWKKVLDKNFDFGFIQKLLNSNLEDMEKSVVDKSTRPAGTKATTPTSVKPKDQGNKEQASTPSTKHSGFFESSLHSLLSGGKASGAESSKIRSMIQPKAPPKEQQPVEQPAPKTSRPYLEDLSDDETQKKVSRPESGTASMEGDTAAGYFSEGGEEYVPEKKEKMEEVTPVKETQDYAIGVSDSSAKKKEAILYDPEMKGEVEAVAYDPLKEYNPVISTLSTQPKHERGAILRLFKGKLRHNMINKETFTSIRGCSFYTCEYCEDIRCFPKLPDDIKIAGRVSQNEALDYIQKLYTKQMKDPTKKQLLVGWVLTKREHNESLQNLAQELLDREKVAVSKYSEYAAIYFLHPSMIKKEIAKNLDWKIKTPEGHSPAKVCLLFVIYMRGSYMPGIFPMVIEPEFIGMPGMPKQDENVEHHSPKKMDVEEHKVAMSPITSEEEEEGEDTMIGDQFHDLVNMIQADPDLQNAKHENASQPAQPTTPSQTTNVPATVPQTEASITHIPISPGPIVATETTPPQSHTTPTAMVEEKPETSTQLNLDDEYNIIVEKLQKMSREELFEFVASATEDQKEKIISILNTVVEDDSKSEEEKQKEPMETEKPYPQPAPIVQHPQNLQMPLQYPQQPADPLHPLTQIPGQGLLQPQVPVQLPLVQGQINPQVQKPQQIPQMVAGHPQYYQQRPFQATIGGQMQPQGFPINPYNAQAGNMTVSYPNNPGQGRNIPGAIPGMNPQPGFPIYMQNSRQGSYPQSGMPGQYNKGNKKSPQDSPRIGGHQGPIQGQHSGYLGFDPRGNNPNNNQRWKFSGPGGPGPSGGYDRYSGMGPNQNQHQRDNH